MSREPRAVNSYGCPLSVWRRFSEFERHHFNKLFIHVYEHKEKYLPGLTIPPEMWYDCAVMFAMQSTDTVRRGKDAVYRDEKGRSLKWKEPAMLN